MAELYSNSKDEKPTKEKIEEMYKQGHTQEYIAAYFGVGRSRISQICPKFKIAKDGKLVPILKYDTWNLREVESPSIVKIKATEITNQTLYNIIRTTQGC